MININKIFMSKPGWFVFENLSTNSRRRGTVRQGVSRLFMIRNDETLFKLCTPAFFFLTTTWFFHAEYSLKSPFT